MTDNYSHPYFATTFCGDFSCELVAICMSDRYRITKLLSAPSISTSAAYIVMRALSVCTLTVLLSDTRGTRSQTFYISVQSKYVIIQSSSEWPGALLLTAESIL